MQERSGNSSVKKGKRARFIYLTLSCSASRWSNELVTCLIKSYNRYFCFAYSWLRKKRKMRLRDQLQSCNSSENSVSLQGLSSSACCSAPTTSAASRPMSKQKFADANDLGVDDPKQVNCVLILQACLGPRKDAWMLRGIRGGVGWNILSSLMQHFAFVVAIFNLKLENTFEECVVNELLQPMAIVIGSMLLKWVEVFQACCLQRTLACYST